MCGLADLLVNWPYSLAAFVLLNTKKLATKGH